ncbi:carboxymuconolactone decarboxylase family protein [Mycobacterium xenopi 4042]|uniref:Carboxymuconolactone decarboxylase family protein n=1 Tax=Mycobacterium xenopi 4042 TaxID=1299334 RepID=X8CUZ6_MYCXE|nr:carboxymuconolactone decarboxylase family protein [Mycobacterium xenopi 4042]
MACRTRPRRSDWRRDGRTASQRPREDERGLRLGDAGYAGEYFALTVDHLFGRIWTRPGLSMRDKRLMTLSVVTALGQQDLAEVQVNAALQNGELTEDELREVAIFLTHYVGSRSARD